MHPPVPPEEHVTVPSGIAMPVEGITRSRCRSFCFLERRSVRWTAFLITYQRPDGFWRGHFSFRSAETGLTELTEVRTADLFVEETEEELDARARGLGRPLVMALLESAIEADERRRGPSPDVQRWFREMLRGRSTERAHAAAELESAASLAELRSLYESYRLDQVAHLIGLLEPDDFRELVEIRLVGRRVDFNARDRLQLAMSVVQEIERRLPLPPFEIWAEDYLAHPLEYRRYTAALHADGELP